MKPFFLYQSINGRSWISLVCLIMEEGREGGREALHRMDGMDSPAFQLFLSFISSVSSMEGNNCITRDSVQRTIIQSTSTIAIHT